eukprot:scaffold1477_cov188-Alexandrium_tamarense.AAC.12
MTTNDDFWAVAMRVPSSESHEHDGSAIYDTVLDGDVYGDDDNEEVHSIVRTFTILPPTESDGSYEDRATSTRASPLNLRIQLNCNDGILSDVSGIPWDAALLLAGYLYGTEEGRHLCFDACFGGDNIYDGGSPLGGILELGSGLGIVGLAAAASVLSSTSRDKNYFDNESSTTSECNNKRILGEITTSKLKVTTNSNNVSKRVVLSDRNDLKILAHLQKNVDANIDMIKSENENGLSITVEPCDWVEVSSSLHTFNQLLPLSTSDEEILMSPKYQSSSDVNKGEYPRPRGSFNLIIGSALVYTPDHATACADTIFHYLTTPFGNIESQTSQSPTATEQRHAVIVQLPDRSGFTTHFLPRCHELGLTVSCKELDNELIERVERGCNRSIPSVNDYRMYVITRRCLQCFVSLTSELEAAPVS